MIKVYYAYTEFVNEDALYKLIKPISKLVQSRITNFKRKEDQLKRMAGYFLLKEALDKMAFHGYRLSDLQYSVKGKPFISGVHFDFSISYTEQCVALAFSDSRVGIDIEKIKAIDFTDFENIFPGEVWSSINASVDKTGAFYTYWTLLESVVKADGRGLPLASSNHLLFNTNHVIIEGEKWYFQHQHFDRSVSCCVASDSKTGDY